MSKRKVTIVGKRVVRAVDEFVRVAELVIQADADLQREADRVWAKANKAKAQQREQGGNEA